MSSGSTAPAARPRCCRCCARCAPPSPATSPRCRCRTARRRPSRRSRVSAIRTARAPMAARSRPRSTRSCAAGTRSPSSARRRRRSARGISVSAAARGRITSAAWPRGSAGGRRPAATRPTCRSTSSPAATSACVRKISNTVAATTGRCRPHPAEPRRAMARFFAKHLAFLLLTLFVVSFLVFTLNEFSPGAVARKILGAYATQEQVDVLTRQMGLDRPLLVRYVDYLRAVAAGDPGQSPRFKAPVREVIGKHLANTALLAALAFACIVPLSMVLGVAAGMREGSRLDRAILMLSTVVASIPEFALGVFLASVFVVWLGWLPGTATLVAGGGWSVAAQLVLPVTVVVLFDSGYVVSMISASMVEVMQRPYIRTAVLKGLPFRAVILSHALRNAMLTPITVIMLQINYLVAGVVGASAPRQRRRGHCADLGGAGASRPADRAVPAERQRHGGARPHHSLEGALAGYRSARARPVLAHSVGRPPGPHHRAARGARRRGTRLASRPGGRLLRTLDRPRHHARVRHRALVPGHHPLHDHPRPLRLLGVEHRRRPHADQGADHRPHRAWHDA